MMAEDVMLFPDPLSPSKAVVVPLNKSNVTPRVTGLAPLNATERFRICRRGGSVNDFPIRGSRVFLARVQWLRRVL